MQQQHSELNKLNAVFVCGPWGSGTSLVTKLLLKVGFLGLEPYFMTNDPKTPNSYEAVAFRNLLMRYCDEEFISRKVSKDLIISELIKFQQSLTPLVADKPTEIRARPFVFKHALSALILEELNSVFDCQFIFVKRPLEEIEAGRLRRDWRPYLGAQGAEIINGEIEKFARTHPQNSFFLDYKKLTSTPKETIQALLTFLNVKAAENGIKIISQIVRPA